MVPEDFFREGKSLQLTIVCWWGGENAVGEGRGKAMGGVVGLVVIKLGHGVEGLLLLLLLDAVTPHPCTARR